MDPNETRTQSPEESADPLEIGLAAAFGSPSPSPPDESESGSAARIRREQGEGLGVRGDAATNSHHAAESPGTIIAGKYKLLQQIGEGGMGSVWMADQIEPVKRRVAVKLIRTERGSSKTILSRFEAERQAIALMDHPNIAKLLDAGTTEQSQPYFVMELVKGIPLTDFCDQHKLPIPDRLQLFLQICSAVQHAHQKGIIHRDLKPSNILVESHDGNPVPKVIDFGLAKATSGMQLTENTLFTGFGSVLGTPMYMAPEQANFNAIDVDTRADIYALGVILYELLTGSTPLTRETIKKAQLDEMLKLIREQEAPMPSSRLSTSDAKPSVAANRQTEPLKLGRIVKGELDWIVMKSLSKERERRYETANGFAKDVERYLNHEPVQAGPVGTGYRIRKFVRRNRPQVVAASLLLFALLAGIAGTTFGLIRANRSAEAERLAKIDADVKRAEAEQARAAEAERAKGERHAKLRAEASEKLAGERLVQVEASKKKAETGQHIVQATMNFLLLKLLRQADVTMQADDLLRLGGHDAVSDAKENPTIRELLDRAATELTPNKIETDFPNQPLVQASVLNLIGQTYVGIGEFHRAIHFLQRSNTLYRKYGHPDDPQLLYSMGQLGGAYSKAGKHDMALPLLEESLELSKKIRGLEHIDTINSLNSLGVAYWNELKTDKALPLFQEAMRLSKKHHGPDNTKTIHIMYNVASVYDRMGKPDLALPILIEVVKHAKMAEGSDHPNTLDYMNGLAVAYRNIGMLDLALPLQEETLRITIEKRGPEHFLTLLYMANLARVHRAAGNYDLALPLFEQALKHQKKKLGPNHHSTLSTMSDLANTYWLEKRFDKSIPLYEEGFRISEVKHGRDHQFTLASMANLGVNYKDANRIEEARPLLEEAYRAAKKYVSLRFCGPELLYVYLVSGSPEQATALRKELVAEIRKTHPTNSPQLALELAQIGGTLLKAKAYTDAELLLQECKDIREKVQPNAWSTFNTQSMLGEALLGQKKFVDSEPLLLKGYEGIKQRVKTIPPQGKGRIPEALDRLIELYTATSKPDEVKKWQAERAKFPPSETK